MNSRMAQKLREAIGPELAAAVRKSAEAHCARYVETDVLRRVIDTGRCICGGKIRSEVYLDPRLWAHEYYECTNCAWNLDKVITSGPVKPVRQEKSTSDDWKCRGCGKINKMNQPACGIGEWNGCGGARAEYESQDCWK